MANEDKDLEYILVEKEAPKRVEAKENVAKRVAKLTGRTITSLKEKIKENRLDKAYAKYNKKYQKMKEAAKVASDAQKAQEAGEKITNSELAVEYSIVASYDKKLAKMGAKLLKDDIKTVAAGMDVSKVATISKRIKVPRFLLTKMRKLAQTVEKIRTKQEQKRLQKVMKKQTKEYIKSSLDGAVFKEDGSLQEKINPEVIKNLGLKGGKNDTERRLDSLRGFISLDGKTALFENKTEHDDELEKETKTKTDLPPSEPEATVEKGEEKVNVNDLLKGFAKQDESNKKEDLTKQEKWKKTFDEIDAGLKEDYKKSEIVEQDNEPKQQNIMKDLDEKISVLKTIMEKPEYDTLKSMLTEQLEKLQKEKEAIVVKAEDEKKDELSKDVSNGEKQKAETIIKKEKDVEETNIMDPIEIKSKETKTSSGVMENVEVKNPKEIRVSQVGKPAALRVTLQDIKKLEERNKNAQVQIAQLRIEKEKLEQEKAMLKEYIVQANMTRDAEMQARNMAESNNLLKSEIAELNSQAAEINLDLGRSK